MLEEGRGVTGASSLSSFSFDAGAIGIFETVFFDATAVEGALAAGLALEAKLEGVLASSLRAIEDLVAEAVDVEEPTDLMGVALGDPLTNDFEVATDEEEPVRGTLEGDEEFDDGTFSGERALLRLASFFCSEDKSRDPASRPAAGLLTEGAEEDAFARSGEVERDAEREADRDAEREVVRELMRDPA